MITPPSPAARGSPYLHQSSLDEASARRYNAVFVNARQSCDALSREFHCRRPPFGGFRVGPDVQGKDRKHRREGRAAVPQLREQSIGE